MFKKLISTAAVLGFAAAAIGPAVAGTSSVSVQANLDVVASCALSNPSGSALDFPTMAPSGTPLGAGIASTVAHLSYACSTGLSPTLSLSDASNTGTTTFTLVGANPANTVPFNISQDVVSNPDFTNNAAANQLPTGVAGPSAIDLIGEIPAGTTVSAADIYADSVLATLNF